MSLRNRIVVLFFIFAVLPLLSLAGLAYWQAESLLMAGAQTHLSETLTVLSAQVAEEVEAIREALDAMSEEPAEHLLPSGALEKALYVRTLDSAGEVLAEAGRIPGRAGREASDRASGIVWISSERSPGVAGRTAEAAFHPSVLLAAAGGSPVAGLLLLDLRSSSVVHSVGFPGIAAGDPLSSVPELDRIGGDTATGPVPFRYRSAGERRLGAYVPISGSDLALMASVGPAAALAPLNRLVFLYWAFVLLLAASTIMAFTILTRRFTRSLGELARAAEKIGEGEMDPWLPLSTSGEVGQLTMAFNRMLVRIREMMSQLDQSGRLAVVGQLSAYFAHEIRNPLSSIKLNLQRLQRWAQRGDLPANVIEPIEISLREVDRLSASVSDVLQLSRTPETPVEVVGLHGLVDEAGQLLRARFQGQGVDLRLDLDAQADRVLARPGQVKSVILNLMVNALEAQPEGGFLEVRSRLVSHPDLGGPALAVHFRDGGPGVPTEVRDRIFEPFFTTKRKGSGIGLAVASRCVLDNRGLLYLQPTGALGSGAEFVMAFPLASVADSAGHSRTEPQSSTIESSSSGTAGESSTIPPSRSGRGVPAHLLTPEGLNAVMALAHSEREEMN